jgi:hypothetical protein
VKAGRTWKDNINIVFEHLNRNQLDRDKVERELDQTKFKCEFSGSVNIS